MNAPDRYEKFVVPDTEKKYVAELFVSVQCRICLLEFGLYFVASYVEELVKGTPSLPCLCEAALAR